MAVVGEPTGLDVATAHKGVLRFEIAAHGKPAHSSKPHLGVNAISAMAPVMMAIQSDYIPRLQDVVHPLVGPPTLNVSTIRGGTAQNIVPAECVISIDRRVNPGESPEAILAAIDSLLESLPSGDARVERRMPTLVTSPLDTAPDHPLVVALQCGREQVLGERGKPMGMTFGTDASLFAPAGISCVVFGPGSIDQAHSDDEWVEVEDVAKAAEILAEAMTSLA
jgi:succinyl-diaminopimelate desuccinylase